MGVIPSPADLSNFSLSPWRISVSWTSRLSHGKVRMIYLLGSPLAPKAEEQAPRKRLVPKKSKLGLLGVSSNKTKDMSDVVRRVGGSASTSRGGFEIYVDPQNDPDIGDMVMVKKKKSRAALNGLKWGPLGEVTNVPSAPKEKESGKGNLLKLKSEEKDKWWSIRRGTKDKSASLAAPDTLNLDNPATRARFNSLDSGVLLSSPTAEVSPLSASQNLQIPQPGRTTVVEATSEPDTANDAPSPTFLAIPPATGSIAIRAMRSMKSMARISSWAQLKPNEKEANADGGTKKEKSESKKKEKSEPKKKEKSELKKKKKEKEGREQTLRSSGSGFEAGTMTSPEAETFQD
ncbi:hypothetical protein EW146_g8298, partial [Bondarzewia mesenterica]